MAECRLQGCIFSVAGMDVRVTGLVQYKESLQNSARQQQASQHNAMILESARVATASHRHQHFRASVKQTGLHNGRQRRLLLVSSRRLLNLAFDFAASQFALFLNTQES